MPLREVFVGIYLWANSQAVAIALACLAWGVGGALLARFGKGGRSDRYGRTVASVVLGGAVLVLIVAAMALGIAHVGFKKGLLDANVLLLAAPVLCVLASVVGIGWVFPLSELATVRTLRELGLFVLACAAGLWLLSRFRGWGVVFLGGIGDIVVIAVMALGLLWVLYRAAFSRSTR